MESRRGLMSHLRADNGGALSLLRAIRFFAKPALSPDLSKGLFRQSI